MLDCTICATRGSSGRVGLWAAASHVVEAPAELTPTFSRVFSNVGSTPNTPIEPVIVVGSAMISSAAIAIQ